MSKKITIEITEDKLSTIIWALKSCSNDLTIGANDLSRYEYLRNIDDIQLKRVNEIIEIIKDSITCDC